VRILSFISNAFSPLDRSIKVGSKVTAFDPLCEVQSDKASVEITSPFDGVVTEILVKEGDIAKVGAGLCIIEHEEGGSSTQETTSTSTPTSTSAKEEPTPAQAPEQPAKPRGLHPLDPSHTTPRKLHELRIGSHPGMANRSKDSFDTESLFSKNAANVLAPPSIRHLAKLSGIDLAKIAPGSGKDGRIEKGDLDAYLARGSSAPKTAEPKAVEDEAVVELGRTRYNMWKAMVKVRCIYLSIPISSDSTPEPRNPPLWILDFSRYYRVAQHAPKVE